MRQLANGGLLSQLSEWRASLILTLLAQTEVLGLLLALFRAQKVKTLPKNTLYTTTTGVHSCNVFHPSISKHSTNNYLVKPHNAPGRFILSLSYRWVY